MSHGEGVNRGRTAGWCIVRFKLGRPAHRAPLAYKYITRHARGFPVVTQSQQAPHHHTTIDKRRSDINKKRASGQKRLWKGGKTRVW